MKLFVNKRLPSDELHHLPQENQLLESQKCLIGLLG